MRLLPAKAPADLRRLAVALLAVFNAACTAPVPTPRLLVLVVIDQFPRELLDRFGPLFGAGGFRRLLEQGADFTDCHHEMLGTFTGPGHAVAVSGAYPVETGIVHNAWYSRRAGRVVHCVADESHRIVGLRVASDDREGAAPPPSLSATVGDVLRLATGMRAKVVSVAIKARSAVLLGGQHPNGAYWFDENTCSFVTSTYYARELPAWAAEFNAAAPCERYIGGKWTKVRADVDYERWADVDDAPYERPAHGMGRTFPHEIGELSGEGAGAERYAAVAASPFGNELLFELGRAAIEGEELGRDDVPDLLALGLSSNDLVGHAFGPHSQEVLDITLRTDRLLADFLAFLDARIGKDRWAVVLTSDHGIAPVPEYLERRGLLPVREDHYRRSSTAFRIAVSEALARRFFASGSPPEEFRNVIEAWIQPFVYVNPGASALLPQPFSFDDLLEAVREETLRLEGVRRVYVRSERPALASSQESLDRRAYRSWHPENGGDLLVVMEPYWLDTETAATTHGSFYRYDTHVPMILYGAGVRPGRFARPTEVVDLAPTLARLLRVMPPPMSQGRVLSEAVRD